MDSYELARWQGYLTESEVTALKGLAQELPPDPVLINIGAGAGTSTIAFLEERSDLIAFSIDLLTNGSEITTNEHLRLAEMGLTPRVIKIWGDSKQVGLAWPRTWKVDCVFVDGDHTHDGLVGDILTWESLVKSGGAMVFHDYTRHHHPDVKPTVDQMMSKYKQLWWIDTTIAFEL
jgi:predicted O-methyltransferase YrrM